MIHAEFLRELGGDAMKNHRGTSTRLSLYFDVPPTDAVIPPCAQRLHPRLLGSKAGGKALDAVGFGFTVPNLTLGKDALQKALAEAFNRCRHPRNFDYIDTCPHDHAEKITQALARMAAQNS